MRKYVLGEIAVLASLLFLVNGGKAKADSSSNSALPDTPSSVVENQNENTAEKQTLPQSKTRVSTFKQLKKLHHHCFIVRRKTFIFNRKLNFIIQNHRVLFAHRFDILPIYKKHKAVYLNGQLYYRIAKHCYVLARDVKFIS